MRKILLMVGLVALLTVLVSGVALAAKPDPVPPVKQCKPNGKKACPPPAIDTDGDGVTDDVDQCDNDPGPSSNNGCPLPVDTDGDGITDDVDQCADTPLATEVDETGCPLPVLTDTDGDGVPDSEDACPNEAGDGPDGCPVPVPVDSDGDGVTDDVDACADTPPGTEVDETGCPLPVGDTDGDGVPDNVDECPDTPAEIEVDETGCTILADSDEDGIPNIEDECPYQAGPASNNGCPLPPPPGDSDGDGVTDDVDQCADTPLATEVDETGCPPPSDYDGDGVPDNKDSCPRNAGDPSNQGCPTGFDPGPPPPGATDFDETCQPGDTYTYTSWFSPDGDFIGAGTLGFEYTHYCPNT